MLSADVAHGLAQVLYVDPDIWLVTSASHFFNELTRSKAVRARAARAAGKPPDTRPALLVSQRPEQQYLNFGFWVLEPSVQVFNHIMRAWVRGNHSYFPLFDEQVRTIPAPHSSALDAPPSAAMMRRSRMHTRCARLYHSHD